MYPLDAFYLQLLETFSTSLASCPSPMECSRLKMFDLHLFVLQPSQRLPSGKQRQPYLVNLVSFLPFFLSWVYNCQKQLCALPMPSLKTNRAITYKTSILLLNLFLIILQDGKRNALAVNTGLVGPTVDIEQTQGNTSKKFFFRLPWFNGRYSWLWVNSAISLCDRINDRLPLLILGHNVWNAASKINAVFSLYLAR